MYVQTVTMMRMMMQMITKYHIAAGTAAKITHSARHSLLYRG